jgi:hypothetical protein
MMTDKTVSVPQLTDKDILAIYRNAMYAAMRIGRGHLPTDYQCIQWLVKMRQHAEQLQVGPHLPSVGGFPEQWLMEVGYER